MIFKKGEKTIKLKICGLTNIEDIKYCDSVGIDSVGLLVYDSGKKYAPMNILISKARELVLEIKNLQDNSNSKLQSVLLVKQNTQDDIINIISDISPDVVQMQKETHDAISLKEIRSKFKNIKIIKTIYISDSIDIDKEFKYIDDNEDYIDAVLLDSAKGGSGQTHNWNISAKIAAYVKTKDINVVLAGGLNSENLKAAIDHIKPDMVDIMSSVKDVTVESHKDHKKIDSLVEIIKLYNNEV